MSEAKVCESSWVYSVRYKAEEHLIVVRTKKGTEYEYPATMEEYAELLASPSIGHAVQGLRRL